MQENVKTRSHSPGKACMAAYVHSNRLNGQQQSGLFFSKGGINHTLCSTGQEVGHKKEAPSHTHRGCLHPAFLSFLALNCTRPLLPEEVTQIHKITDPITTFNLCLPQPWDTLLLLGGSNMGNIGAYWVKRTVGRERLKIVHQTSYIYC